MRWVFLAIVGIALMLILPAILIASLVGSAATDAISNALAYEALASTDQSVINVCVGMVCKNIVTQTSTATTQRTQVKEAADLSPWGIILVISGIILAAVVAVLNLVSR
jgi:hypothetical protein